MIIARIVDVRARWFDLGLYGISEMPGDSSRPERMKHDLDTAVVTLNKEINHSSIRDSFRLGKFKQNQARPRPLLIKLNRAIDVITILANRGSLNDNSILVKPDMSPQEKQKEALLLKHRWSLMQSDISKTDIKIKSSSIYIKGKKYGYILNSEFQLTDNFPPIASSSQTFSN